MGVWVSNGGGGGEGEFKDRVNSESGMKTCHVMS